MAKEMEISVKELEKELIEFLDTRSTESGGKSEKPGCNQIHGTASALGTCIDNKPRVTPIDFYADGLTIWCAGEPGGKIANIMRNPNVSIGIYEPVDHSREQKSLQVWGTASLINKKNDPGKFNKRIAAFGIDEALMGTIEELVQTGQIPQGQEEAYYEKLISLFNLIKVTPEKMVLVHIRPRHISLKEDMGAWQGHFKIAIRILWMGIKVRSKVSNKVYLKQVLLFTRL